MRVEGRTRLKMVTRLRLVGRLTRVHGALVFTGFIERGRAGEKGGDRDREREGGGERNRQNGVGRERGIEEGHRDGQTDQPF